MKLGFIGTGNITVAVVNGICGSKIAFKKILVSSRNKSKALKLSKKFKKVSVAKTNQEIVDKCNWVFLAITPKVGEKIIPKLNFRPNQKIRQILSRYGFREHSILRVQNSICTVCARVC